MTALIAALLSFLIPPPPVVPSYPSPIEQIVTSSMNAGLPPQIALDLFWRESKYHHMLNGEILRGQGGCGIAQLNPRWHPGACAMTQEQSILAGIDVMATAYRKHQSAKWVRTVYTGK